MQHHDCKCGLDYLVYYLHEVNHYEFELQHHDSDCGLVSREIAIVVFLYFQGLFELPLFREYGLDGNAPVFLEAFVI